MGVDRIHGHLDLLILSVLDRGPRHGYAIINEIREGSGGRFDMPEGTVYPALHRLERRNLLDSSWAEGATRRRRVYRLSELGRKALVEERAGWAELSIGIRSILRWSHG